eukprot:TRINITY_DN25918_c0_g1_i1.p3 TRINITY_DN25918_c0_g1~~TRINITY_DN25918_c0_g1_i1.p3  ORF type:complete len:61 (-),score=2.54 TRINITY_DN25918_c0_g1_i1:163-345(-)
MENSINGNNTSGSNNAVTGGVPINRKWNNNQMSRLAVACNRTEPRDIQGSISRGNITFLT